VTKNATGARRLDLDAIDASLRAVQRDFKAINRQLATPRDPLSDQVREQLMLGYRLVDEQLAAGVGPFDYGSSRAVLELNFLVICGEDRELRGDCKHALEATEERFYAKGNGGFESLAELEARMLGDSVWRRTAAAYIQVLSEPQLFIEGNHRTGALIMSWMLGHEGKPPFVLRVDNARGYFDPSSVVKGLRKKSLGMALKRPKMLKQFAALLKNGAHPSHSAPIQDSPQAGFG
jgi:hypothetical protein